MQGQLNLFYRGDRDYLQGSLIVSQAVEWYRSYCERTLIERRRVTQAEFRSIVNNHCRVTDVAEDAPTAAIKGAIRIAGPNGNELVLTIFLDPDLTEPPPRVEDAGSLVKEFELQEEFSGTASYRHPGGFEGMLSTIIEINKRCHRETLPSARNIWFLSFSDCRLQVTDSSYGPTGLVRIRNRTRHTIKGRLLTINEVKIIQDRGEELNLDLVFSCEV